MKRCGTAPKPVLPWGARCCSDGGVQRGCGAAALGAAFYRVTSTSAKSLSSKVIAFHTLSSSPFSHSFLGFCLVFFFFILKGKLTCKPAPPGLTEDELSSALSSSGCLSHCPDSGLSNYFPCKRSELPPRHMELSKAQIWLGERIPGKEEQRRRNAEKSAVRAALFQRAQFL